MTPLLTDRADVVAPDLRWFGASDKHPEDPASAYSAAAQARSVLGLVDELGIDAPVLAGYDIRSRIAQTIARTAPEGVRALVVCPPLPGVGERVLSADAQREFWYQAFHQLELADELVDGKPAAVRAYLRQSLGWYRAGSRTVATSLAEVPPDPRDRIAVPTTVLWPDSDPLFPQAWGDRLGEFFSDASVRRLSGAGHFVPLEAPHDFAAAVRDALT